MGRQFTRAAVVINESSSHLVAHSLAVSGVVVLILLFYTNETTTKSLKIFFLFCQPEAIERTSETLAKNHHIMDSTGLDSEFVSTRYGALRVAHLVSNLRYNIVVNKDISRNR